MRSLYLQNRSNRAIDGEIILYDLFFFTIYDEIKMCFEDEYESFILDGGQEKRNNDEDCVAATTDAKHTQSTEPTTIENE